MGIWHIPTSFIAACTVTKIGASSEHSVSELEYKEAVASEGEIVEVGSPLSQDAGDVLVSVRASC